MFTICNPILAYVTFDSKVISVNYSLRRYLHNINNNCAKFEDPLLKYECGGCVTNVTFDSNVISVFRGPCSIPR